MSTTFEAAQAHRRGSLRLLHMGYPAAPWPPLPPPPRRNAADVAISIIAMIITVLVGGAGAVMGLLSLAFLDNCPPESCSVNGAVTAVMTTVAVAGIVGAAGLILTIVRLSARKTAWPLAVGTLATCIAIFAIGAVALTAAVS